MLKLGSSPEKCTFALANLKNHATAHCPHTFLYPWKTRKWSRIYVSRPLREGNKRNDGKYRGKSKVVRGQKKIREIEPRTRMIGMGNLCFFDLLVVFLLLKSPILFTRQNSTCITEFGENIPSSLHHPLRSSHIILFIPLTASSSFLSRLPRRWGFPARSVWGSVCASPCGLQSMPPARSCAGLWSAARA